MKTMEAFKFRLVPTPEQEALLNRHAGCVRFVWNKPSISRKNASTPGSRFSPAGTWPSS